MAIAFDNVAFDTTKDAAASVLLTAAANASLLVFAFNNNSQSVSAMAYAGVPLTRFRVAEPLHELWVLSAPASGINTLSAAWTGVGGRLGLIALTYTGVKQIAGFGTAVSNIAATVTNGNLSQSATTTDLVVGSFFMTMGGLSTVNNGTTRGSASCSANIKVVVADITGAPSVTLSASAASVCDFYMLGIHLIASASTALRHNLALTGVGR